MMTTLRTAYRRVHATLAAHTFVLYWLLSSVVMFAASTVDGVHPVYWVGLLFLAVVVPLLRKVLDLKFEREDMATRLRDVTAERDAWKGAMDDVTAQLREMNAARPRH